MPETKESNLSSSENPYEPPQTETDAVDAEMICLKCGSVMLQGFIQSFGNITWYPEMASFKRSVPQRLSPKGFNLETKLPALKCPTCQTVTVKTPDA